MFLECALECRIGSIADLFADQGDRLAGLDQHAAGQGHADFVSKSLAERPTASSEKSRPASSEPAFVLQIFFADSFANSFTDASWLLS
jgi:hypothetical protein